MATVQVRDVPDDVAEVIAKKATAEHKSVSAYLRELMTADAKQELQRQAISRWDSELEQTLAGLDLPSGSTATNAEIVREIRDEYDRDDA